MGIQQVNAIRQVVVWSSWWYEYGALMWCAHVVVSRACDIVARSSRKRLLVTELLMLR